MSADSFDIVVLGGGASGTLVAAHLLSRAGEGLRIALVEPREQLAQGVAYSTGRGEHVLNVPAGKMSALDAEPDDFLRFLRTQPDYARLADDDLRQRFMPRRVYARYLHDVLARQPRADALERIVDAAVDLWRDGGAYVVRLASGRELSARAVVLAIGNHPAKLPVAANGVPVVEAWDYPAVSGIATDANVGIVGAGLSMMDAVLTLQANGHRGHIDVLSRHGLAPLAHEAPGALPDAGEVAALLPMGVRQRMHRLRERAADAVAAGQPWQWAIDTLRPHVQALWAALSHGEQRRFLRHGVRHWDIHRHRVAPEVGEVLGASIAAGRLRVHAGRLLGVDEGALCWRPRGGGEARRVAVDVIVNATGMEKGILRAPGLLAAMLKRDLLAPGPHGIGIATAADGTVLDAHGEALAGVWTLGAARVGSLWESIAMPELRGQAERAAAAARAFVTSEEMVTARSA